MIKLVGNFTDENPVGVESPECVDSIKFQTAAVQNTSKYNNKKFEELEKKIKAELVKCDIDPDEGEYIVPVLTLAGDNYDLRGFKGVPKDIQEKLRTSSQKRYLTNNRHFFIIILQDYPDQKDSKAYLLDVTGNRSPQLIDVTPEEFELSTGWKGEALDTLKLPHNIFHKVVVLDFKEGHSKSTYLGITTDRHVSDEAKANAEIGDIKNILTYKEYVEAFNKANQDGVKTPIVVMATCGSLNSAVLGFVAENTNGIEKLVGPITWMAGVPKGWIYDLLKFETTKDFNNNFTGSSIARGIRIEGIRQTPKGEEEYPIGAGVFDLEEVKKSYISALLTYDKFIGKSAKKAREDEQSLSSEEKDLVEMAVFARNHAIRMPNEGLVPFDAQMDIGNFAYLLTEKLLQKALPSESGALNSFALTICSEEAFKEYIKKHKLSGLTAEALKHTHSLAKAIGKSVISKYMPDHLDNQWGGMSIFAPGETSQIVDGKRVWQKRDVGKFHNNESARKELNELLPGFDKYSMIDTMDDLEVVGIRMRRREDQQYNV